MICDSCKSERILEVYGKTSDLCSVRYQDQTHDGYVPYNLGIGGGDDLSFELCLDCGKIQGKFPIPVYNLDNGDV